MMQFIMPKKFKLILAASIANIFEWYDYALFGHFAAIIGDKFFPVTDQRVVLLQVFLVFAIGYLMRPVGGIFFGIIGDRFGRRFSLSLSIMCMAVPTAIIGFLPSYETIGLTSTIIMIICRLLQGLSMGGALTGSISYIIEHTPKKQRGLYSSVTMVSICIGILLGSFMSFLVQKIFSAEEFNDWAWRLPFILGMLVFFAGLYIKNYIGESPIFDEMQKQGELTAKPVRLAFCDYWSKMIISIFINAAGSIIFYFEAIYLTSYLVNNRGFSGDTVSVVTNSCYLIMILVIILVGYLSDRFGRRLIMLINLLLICMISPVMLPLIETGTYLTVIFAQITIAIIAAAYIGAEPALQAELYPAKIRNTALSISYNLATSVFGGTSPYIIESIVQNTGSMQFFAYYLVAISICGLIALYFYRASLRP